MKLLCAGYMYHLILSHKSPVVPCALDVSHCGCAFVLSLDRLGRLRRCSPRPPPRTGGGAAPCLPPRASGGAAPRQLTGTGGGAIPLPHPPPGTGGGTDLRPLPGAGELDQGVARPTGTAGGAGRPLLYDAHRPVEVAVEAGHRLRRRHSVASLAVAPPPTPGGRSAFSISSCYVAFSLLLKCLKLFHLPPATFELPLHLHVARDVGIHSPVCIRNFILKLCFPVAFCDPVLPFKLF